MQNNPMILNRFNKMVECEIIKEYVSKDGEKTRYDIQYSQPKLIRGSHSNFYETYEDEIVIKNVSSDELFYSFDKIRLWKYESSKE